MRLAFAHVESRWLALSALALTVLFSWVERSGTSYLLPQIGRSFGWGISEVGARGSLLFSVFFVGYGLSLIGLSGPAQRYGAIRSLYLVVMGSAAVTIATGLSAVLFGSSAFQAMVYLRLVLGITEGVHLPMISVLVREWFPPTERSRANAAFVGATLMANIATPFAVLPGAARFSWMAMIIALGATSLLSVPMLWVVTAYAKFQTLEVATNDPASDPSSARAAERLIDVLPGLMFLGICINLCFYAVLTWLPAYLDHASPGVGADSLSLELMLPNIACAAGLAGWAWLGDSLGRKLILSAVGFAILGVFIWLSMWATRAPWIVGLVSIALMGLMAYAAYETALIQRIATARSIGRLVGWYNGVGMLVGGSVGTFAIGRLIAHTKRYDLAMLIVVPVALAASAASWRLAKRVAY